ncbi:MAG: monovalent cation/H+ antiporter complex subunit F [Nocardioides sp.]|nr:monovalent cation/H+ antiporter complex subunit F [Nocardioides sp.]
MSPVVVTICLVLLSVAIVSLVVRMTVGPTVLDRAVSFDVLVSITIIGLALEAAVNRHTDTIPVLLVLTLLGFVGSVSIARFINPRDVDDEEAPL